MEIDWSKAPEGATHYGPAVAGRWLRCWMKKEGGSWFGILDDGIDTKWSKLYDTSTNSARIESLIERPSKIWADEELPPIGSYVVVHDDGSLMYGQGESGEVLAHIEGCAVIRMSYGLGCFLPRCLRTPEQIAAEKYEEDAKELAKILNDFEIYDSIFVAKTLLDCGYSKQVTP